MIPDTWHLTPDTWNVTCDMWHVTHGGGWTFSQNFSSLAPTVWDLWCHEDWEEKDRSVSSLINDKTVCRSAPATPGLLINYISIGLVHLSWDVPSQLQMEPADIYFPARECLAAPGLDIAIISSIALFNQRALLFLPSRGFLLHDVKNSYMSSLSTARVKWFFSCPEQL